MLYLGFTMKYTAQQLNRLSFFVRTILTILIATIAVFAVFSGAEKYGGGIRGLIKNSPNALPWLLLLVPIIIAWKSEKVGGIVLFILGLGLVYFFNTGPNFFLTTFLVTCLIPTMGGLLWLISILRKKGRKLL